MTKKRNDDWEANRIRAELMLKGVSQVDICNQLGLNRTAVTKTLKQSWPHVEEAIAKAIGVTPKLIWPSRYDDDGISLKGRVNPNQGKKPC